MKYADLRLVAKSGDLILQEGRGLVSWFVRATTAQQISHVAMFVWLEDGLWLAEMRNQGFTLTPASQRIPEMAAEGILYWGVAPDIVRLNEDTVRTKTLTFRGRRYSFWSLATVWFAQLVRRPMPSRLVCSTLVERVWSETQYHFVHTPDPGDFMRLCQSCHPLGID